MDLILLDLHVKPGMERSRTNVEQARGESRDVLTVHVTSDMLVSVVVGKDLELKEGRDLEQM